MSSINCNDANKELLKNTGIIAIGQVSTKLLNFLLLPLYTALLTTEEYGLVDLLSTYTSLIVVIVGLQMNQAIFRFLVTSRDNKEKIKITVSTITVASIIAIAVYALLFCGIQAFISLSFKWYLLIQVAVSIGFQTLSGISRGLGYNKYYAAGSFISAALTLLLNVVAIAVLHLGVGAMLVSYIIGPVVGGIYLFTRCRVYKYIALSKASRSELKTIIAYSIPLIPNELSWSLIHSSDRMIVSAVLTVAANGMIAVASKFSAIYTTFFSIFNTSWTEQVVLHYKDEGGPEYVSDMFDKMVTFFGTLAIGVIVCMPFAFNLFVNEQFADAYELVPLYMMAVFFNAVIGMISAIYAVENETGRVAVSTMAAAVINIVVDLILIKFVGMYAAPISSICAYAAMSFWRLRDINKRHCRITMNIKKIILLLIALGVSLISFFSGLLMINAIAFILIVIFAFIINKEFLMEVSKLFKIRIRKG